MNMPQARQRVAGALAAYLYATPADELFDGDEYSEADLDRLDRAATELVAQLLRKSGGRRRKQVAS